MASNPEPGSTAPAGDTQPKPVPSEPATGTNAGGDKPTTNEYEPKSFGAGVKKAEAEAKVKLDALQAKLTAIENDKKAAEVNGASAEELRKKLTESEQAREALAKQAENLRGHVKSTLESRMAALPEEAQVSIKPVIESGELGSAEAMLAMAERLIGQGAPVKSSPHKPVSVSTETYDRATYDRLMAESWKDNGKAFGAWVAKHGHPPART